MYFIWPNLKKIIKGIQGECVKDCCSHGPLGGITSKWTCYYFSHSWQVKSDLDLNMHPAINICTISGLEGHSFWRIICGSCHQSVQRAKEDPFGLGQRCLNSHLAQFWWKRLWSARFVERWNVRTNRDWAICLGRHTWSTPKLGI